jgi:hypothetical protein
MRRCPAWTRVLPRTSLAVPATGLGQHERTDQERQHRAQRESQAHALPPVSRPMGAAFPVVVASRRRVQRLARGRRHVRDGGRGLWCPGGGGRPDGDDARQERRQADADEGTPPRPGGVPRRAGRLRTVIARRAGMRRRPPRRSQRSRSRPPSTACGRSAAPRPCPGDDLAGRWGRAARACCKRACCGTGREALRVR